MRTIADLVEDARSLDSGRASAGAWPRFAEPRAKFIVPGERPILLPIDLAGLTAVDGPGSLAYGLDEEQARAARAALIYAPSVVIPLRRPSDEALVALAVDPAKFKHENPRAVAVAVAIRLAAGRTIYGTSRLIVLETEFEWEVRLLSRTRMPGPKISMNLTACCLTTATTYPNRLR